MSGSQIGKPQWDAEQRRLKKVKSLEASPPLGGWTHVTTEVPASGLSRERAATAEERALVAAALGVNAVDRLVSTYEIRSVAGGGWRLTGDVAADVVQSCVVTLEPIAQTIAEPFEVEFWPEAKGGGDGGDQSVLEGVEDERLDGDEIPVGRIVFETLSAALDPYPRKPGATLEWREEGEKDKAKTSPFAVLSKLKDKD